jgi:hypothetical protein
VNDIKITKDALETDSWEIISSTIGLRVYMLSVQLRQKPTSLTFDTKGGGLDVPNFVSEFIKSHSAVTEVSDKERSWNFDEKIKEGPGTSKGLIHYGMHGFESKIIDTKTRKKQYDRQVTDSEIIPLYYHFWHPTKSNYLLVALQSFQGRSCISLVTSQMQHVFERKFPQHLLRFRKLMPTSSSASIYRDLPVQKLTFIKHNASSDIADQYSGFKPAEPVRIEMSMIAKRKGRLGSLNDVFQKINPTDNGILTQEGIGFDEAVANVRIGKGVRPVGVFGGNSDCRCD